MDIIDTTIPDVKIIESAIFSDERGFFMVTWQQNRFDELVTPCQFVQDNHSKSERGTLRGLHYKSENTQGKLVRVISGEVYDVALDMRKSSSTFGQWVGVWLSAENRRQIWIPAGFAHGFYVTSEFAEFVYKCTDYYNPHAEHSVLWSDEILKITWPVSDECQPRLSVKDREGTPFSRAIYLD